MKTDIQDSWDKNADEWIRVIQANEIPSRKFTNKAIINLLKELKVNKILDCGCGEGWLSREITGLGKTAVGIDSTEKLILEAREKGNEAFYNISYEEIMGGNSIPGNPYDAAVFNFSLYQEKGMATLLKKTKNNIKPEGLIIIQTLHPSFIMKNGDGYLSQWFTDSWKGLPGDFCDGHSWYARTFEDWIKVFVENDLNLLKVKEILNYDKEPVSILFVIS